MRKRIVDNLDEKGKFLKDTTIRKISQEEIDN